MGKAYDFLAGLLGNQSDECIPFPFSRNDEGYGTLGHNGARYKAHRLMCRLAHGEPPSPQHNAAHLCGKGHEGCVNPNHLAWKTQAENLADRHLHGTLTKKRWDFNGILTEEQVQYVRSMRGRKPQRKLAAELGVSLSCISQIMTGRSRRPIKLLRYWTPEEDERIRELNEQGKNFSQIARTIGRDAAGVGRRARRMGLKPNYVPWAKGTITSEIDLY
jgi:hypothetical protein